MNLRVVLISVFLLGLLLVFEQVVSAASLADPTRPPMAVPKLADLGPADAAPPAWRLSMLRLSGSQPLALLNGSLLKPGDHLGGAKVVSITRAGVELLLAGERIMVSMSGTPVKQVSGPQRAAGK